MRDLLDTLSAGWVGNLLGVVGLIAGYWFYRRSLRFTRLSHHDEWFEVIGYNTPPEIAKELEVRFEGETVPQLSVCKVILWNSGNDTLGGGAISTKDPLRIQTSSEGKILSAKVVKVTRPACGVDLQTDSSDVRIGRVTFDFLDPGDGAVFQIIHTDACPWTEVAGTVSATELQDLAWNGGVGAASRRVAMLAAVLISITCSIWLVALGVEFGNAIAPYAARNPLDWRFGIALLGTVFGTFLTWNYGIRSTSRGRHAYPPSLKEERAP